ARTRFYLPRRAAACSERPTSRGLSGMGRVVFVEDDPAIRKLVQAALRSTTHELHVATNGREGLELIQRVRPDVVFTDVSMPELDGIHMAHARRDHAEVVA